MSKALKPSRKTVVIQTQPRPSRIRRDPPPPASPVQRPMRSYPAEHEVWMVAVGVILFALAISIITVGISQITSH